MALFGSTFENQLIAAFDQAAFQHKVLGDGVLRGFGLSFSGSTLTAAAGYLLAAGRVIGNDAALAIPVSGTSGYARVVIKIDLTGAATESAFSQLSTRVDTSGTVDGFSALVQEDINDGVHSVYEVALAVVALGSGGITSVVSQLGATKLPEGSVAADQIVNESIPGSKLAGILPANVGIKIGTATPTAGTGSNQISEGQIYVKYTP